jgi:hypothetical protein
LRFITFSEVIQWFTGALFQIKSVIEI